MAATLTFIIVIQIIFVLLVLILIIYLLNIIVSFRKMVPYVPSPFKIIRKMVKLAEISPSDRLIDLGSGSGRIIITLACKYTNSVMGIDNSPVLVYITKLRFWLNKIFGRLKTKQYKIIKGDFLNFDLSGYNIVFCFLTSQAMEKLKSNFEKLPVGAKIVSYHFQLTSPLFTEERIQLSKKEKVFIYKKVL